MIRAFCFQCISQYGEHVHCLSSDTTGSQILLPEFFFAPFAVIIVQLTIFLHLCACLLRALLRCGTPTFIQGSYIFL